MESLFAYSYLWAWGFCSMQKYNACLDKMFSDAPDNEVLLELEECSDNCKNTFARLRRFFEYETNSFDSDKFGKTLFHGLEVAYKSKVYSINEFGSRCYELWNTLPGFLDKQQPFWTLSYADDPLSWGDEKQSRTLYEEAFSFYKE